MKKGKNPKLLFIRACLVIMLIPSLGMLVAPTMTTTENKAMMTMPQLKTEEGWQTDYLSALGDYFQEHFALRQELISVNAAIWGGIFQTSTTSEVLLGTDGWMYYSGDLPDYQCQNVLSDRGIFNAVHNLKLIQGYAKGHDSTLIVTIAPNKTSIYDAHMPYYYKKTEGENNLSKLSKAMEEAGINYVDLYAPLKAVDEVVYLERDSHWNNQGAAIASSTLMDAAGITHEDYTQMPYEVRKDHLGDLTKLLYPKNSELEENVYYQKEWQYRCRDDVTDYMEDWIETKSTAKGATGTLLMYRDSFGESMLPFMAEGFEKGYFSRLVPYNLNNISKYKPDTVIIERVERRIPAFAEEAPVMAAPSSKLRASEESGEETQQASLNASDDDIYILLKGTVDQSILADDTEIYVQITDAFGETKTFVPFYITDDNGDNNFELRVPKAAMAEGTYTAQVLILKDGKGISVGVFTIE